MQTILIEKNAGIGRLILNRPHRLNSFNETLHQEYGLRALHYGCA